jgi:hypothetical protein
VDAKLGKLLDRMQAISARPTLPSLKPDLPDVPPEIWLWALAQIGVRQAEERKLGQLIATQLGLPRGAKERLLLYMRSRVGEVVDKDELSGVSGIYEWARRLRELRVEEGWPISSSTNRDDLKPGQYLLEAAQLDPHLRLRWQTAHEIRRTGGSARDRILAYFLANLGHAVAKDELQYVARIQEHPRRVRELAEAGWQIESHFDRPALRPGEYLMVSEQRLPATVRQHIKLRFEIMERDGWRCQICSHGAGSGRRLQVHHRKPVALGGVNDGDNLITLCDACHGGIHSLASQLAVDEILHPEAEPVT